ncbi:MAG: hypothetical protein V7637_4666 [Mycobacteriales bacterium]
MMSANPAGSQEPFDEVDGAILDDIQSIYSALDPMPADLLTRIRFALDLENIDVELLRIEDTATIGVRGESRGQTVTFDSEDLTLMVSVTRQPDSTLTLDCWLAPAGQHQVELRTLGDRRSTTADEQGRFVLAGVPPGLAQFVVGPLPTGGGRSRSFVTPSIIL